VRGAFSALTVAVFLGSVPARAADLESVEKLIRQGVELRHQGHDVQALPLFQKAYSEERTPRAAGQLGLCEMAMGYWLDSERHLGEALSFPEHPWVRRNLNDLTSSLASVRQNIGEVVVEGGPRGAEVLINGKAAGHLPLATPLRLGKGVVDVELRAPGYIPTSRSLKITGAVVERLNLVLAQASPAPPAPAPPLLSSSTETKETSGAPTAPVGEPIQPGADDGHKANPRRIAAWTTAGVAGLSLGLGVVETFAWISNQRAFDDHLGPQPSDPSAKRPRDCGSADKDYGGPGCKGLHDDLARARLLTIVGYGLAGVLGLTSAVLFATSRDDRTGTTTAFVCAPSVIGPGVGCRITF
jgi:hypothetical protein